MHNERISQLERRANAIAPRAGIECATDATGCRPNIRTAPAKVRLNMLLDELDVLSVRLQALSARSALDPQPLDQEARERISRQRRSTALMPSGAPTLSPIERRHAGGPAETRSGQVPPIELRRAPGGNAIGQLIGYAAVFDQLSGDLGGFREKIQPGAFRRALAENQDVIATLNHDPSRLLGRVSAGTLRLAEDRIGLHFALDLPATATGKEVRALAARQDLRGASFAFRARLDEWTTENGQEIRTLIDVDLFDVGPTPIPAYPGTSVAAATDADDGRSRRPRLAAVRARLIAIDAPDSALPLARACGMPRAVGELLNRLSATRATLKTRADEERALAAARQPYHSQLDQLRIAEAVAVIELEALMNQPDPFEPVPLARFRRSRHYQAEVLRRARLRVQRADHERQEDLRWKVDQIDPTPRLRAVNRKVRLLTEEAELAAV